MLEQIAAAFERKDYQTAAQLLAQLVQQEPSNPSVQLYVGRLHEAQQQMEAAETVYRQLLQDTTYPKIIAQARQGLQRLETISQQQRQQALAAAKANPETAEQSLLVLEPISGDAKQIAAQKFARIMQLDTYVARQHLPSRCWRLYRTGCMGEMQFYSQQLQQAGIPNFWVKLADIEKINVFCVNYFQSSSPQVTVSCENEQNQLGSLTFDWSEVTQRVEGLLPIFEEVLDFDVRGKVIRKPEILDYVLFCDLHLPSRHSILRLCDRHYQFQQGINFFPPQEQAPPLSQVTNRRNWNNLLNFLNQRLPQVPIAADFTTFAETGLEQIEMLGAFKSHINLFRRQETLWDQAFQLYSGLVFLKQPASRK